MKKLTLAFLTISFTIIVNAQNVGIGTSTPSDKLDVNGNVNINGNLKVNGNSGRSGQTLMMNSNGQQTWVNPFGYKNRIEFLGSNTWIVPADVREIMVEAIGGGGGGAKGGGGGGGAYMFAIVKVAPGDVISITRSNLNGDGAGGELSNATNGGYFQVFSLPIFSRFSIQSSGGGGAIPNMPGAGGSYSYLGDSILFVKGFAGAEGSPTVESYAQISSTDFSTMRKYGDGGICLYNPEIIQKGSYVAYNTATLANIFINYANNFYVDSYYGTGGGGGNTPIGGWGYNGHLGMAAISW